MEGCYEQRLSQSICSCLQAAKLIQLVQLVQLTQLTQLENSGGTRKIEYADIAAESSHSTE